jgi:DNA (cytosine-5)-methyltransferase 1
VEYRELSACDFGAPTTRKRLFVVARRDGLPVVWPKPTHGPGRANSHKTAAECIDWSLPCPSIFSRKKPLAENTMRRIARGIKKYVLDVADPFIVRMGHTGHGDSGKVRSINDSLSTITTKAEHCLVSAFLAKHYGGVTGHEIDKTLGTITTVDHHSLVTAHIQRDFGCSVGSDLAQPIGAITASGNGKSALVATHMIKLRGGQASQFKTAQDLRTPAPTITAGGTHLAEVRAFLIKYYGTDCEPSLNDSLHTITTKDRFGLVTVAGENYQIADIGLRMLSPRELFLCQGFPASYLIDIDFKGKPLTKSAQVRMCGNSVSPPVGAALIKANVGAHSFMGPDFETWEPGLVPSGAQMSLFDLENIA